MFVHLRRTGSDDDAVQALFLDFISQEFLAWVRSHVFVGGCIRNTRVVLFGLFGNFFNVNCSRDIRTTMTDKNTDFLTHLYMLLLFTL